MPHAPRHLWVMVDYRILPVITATAIDVMELQE